MVTFNPLLMSLQSSQDAAIKFEDIIEQAFWEFDAFTKNKEYRHHSHRDLFKRACRTAREKVLNSETNL